MKKRSVLVIKVPKKKGISLGEMIETTMREKCRKSYYKAKSRLIKWIYQLIRMMNVRELKAHSRICICTYTNIEVDLLKQYKFTIE